MSWTIKQPKEKAINAGIALVFVDSVHFLKNSWNNLSKILGESNFCHLSQEFNVNVLSLLKKKIFLLWQLW